MTTSTDQQLLRLNGSTASQTRLRATWLPPGQAGLRPNNPTENEPLQHQVTVCYLAGWAASQASSVVWPAIGSPDASSPRISATVPHPSAITSWVWMVSKLTLRESRKLSAARPGYAPTRAGRGGRAEDPTERSGG